MFTDLKVRLSKADILGQNRNVVRLRLLSQNNTEVTGMISSRVSEFLSLFTETERARLESGTGDPVALDILYHAHENEFRGVKTVQANIVSFRRSKT